MQNETAQAPPEQTEPSLALQREHDRAEGALLSIAERTALIARLDTKPTSADWALWNRDLEARISVKEGKGA